MQLLLRGLIPKPASPRLKLRQFRRCNSSVARTVTTISLPQLLDDARDCFGENPIVLRKIDSIRNIAPSRTIKDYTIFEPKTISLGIVQSTDLKPGLFVDSLVVDPLSNDNKYDELIKQFRKSHPTSNIKIIYGANSEAIKGGVFTCKSPILNHELRLIQDAKPGDGLGKTLNRDLFNDLSFIEVNDKSFSQHAKIEGADSLNFNTTPQDNQITQSDCHIWVYVTSPNESIEKINDSPYFTIINESQDLSVGGRLMENHDPNTFGIDLDKLNKANILVSKSIKNVSRYLTLYQQSNINELLFTLNRETSGYKPLVLLLRSLLRDLHMQESDDVKIARQLKEEITVWAQNSHFELQSKVTPFLEHILLKELTKISQLIINSGDLTLVISNLLNGTRAPLKTGFFGKEIACYGSLEEATAKSHYLEGRIDALFPENEVQKPEECVDDFMVQLKGDVANKKLPELQSRINKFLTQEIIAAPFTIFTLCNVGYLYDLITLNTAFAVTALSIALTANTSQKKIISIISEFKDWYLEKLRLYIDNTTVFLGKRLNDNIASYETTQAKKKQIIKELQSAILEIENADKMLKNRSAVVVEKTGVKKNV